MLNDSHWVFGNIHSIYIYIFQKYNQKVRVNVKLRFKGSHLTLYNEFDQLLHLCILNSSYIRRERAQAKSRDNYLYISFFFFQRVISTRRSEKKTNTAQFEITENETKKTRMTNMLARSNTYVLISLLASNKIIANDLDIIFGRRCLLTF